jgi:hypothetical protein
MLAVARAFWGSGTGIFRCLTRESYSWGGITKSIDRLAAITCLSQTVIESLPAFSAALAIPDLAALIFSAYCNGIRVDFQPPACVIAARSMSNAAKS